MSIDSPAFLCFGLFVIFVRWVVPQAAARPEWLFSAAGLAFILAAAPTPYAAWPVALLLVAGYALIRVQLLRPGSSVVMLGAIGIMVALFVYLKGYSFLAELGFKAHPFFSLGLSYLLFRIIHLIVDTSETAEFRPRTALGYFAYTTFFPSFSSGPVQLYPDFEAAVAEKSKPRVQDIEANLYRIVFGYVKCIVWARMAEAANMSFYTISLTGGKPHTVSAMLACIAFLFQLYFNFSGFTDVVIGVGRLLGVTLPENFIKTFSARNFLDIWSGWHVSMSNWFKIYMFNPIIKKLITHWPRPRLIPWFGVLGYFITFFVMGLWHGTTTNFVIYGLVLGAGAAANKSYQDLMRKKMGKGRFASLHRNFLYAMLSRGCAFSFFALSLMFFWLDSTQLPHFMIAIGGVPGLLGAFVIGSCLLGALFEACDWLRGVANRLPAHENGARCS